MDFSKDRSRPSASESSKLRNAYRHVKFNDKPDTMHTIEGVEMMIDANTFQPMLTFFHNNVGYRLPVDRQWLKKAKYDLELVYAICGAAGKRAPLNTGKKRNEHG